MTTFLMILDITSRILFSFTAVFPIVCFAHSSGLFLNCCFEFYLFFKLKKQYFLKNNREHAMAQLFEAQRCNLEGREFASR
jgi:hypothetical protein